MSFSAEMATTQQYSQVKTFVPMLQECRCSERTTSESEDVQNEEIFTDMTDLNNRVLSGQGSTMTERNDEFSDKHSACTCNHQNSLKLIVLLNMIVTLVIVIYVLKVEFHVDQRHGKSEQSNHSCLKCETFSSIIDESAWKVVSEDNETETYCFNKDKGLDAMLTHYFEKRFSRSLSEIKRLRKKVDHFSTLVWNHLLSNRTNTTSVHPYTQQDMSTLMQMNNNIFNRKRSVLYLTSLNTFIIEGSDPKISWTSILKQGDISLCNDTCSVSIMSTGIYLIYTQVKYRDNITETINSQTMKTRAQFFLATLREDQLFHVDTYSEERMFRERNIEHDADLHTVARFETGDKLIIRFPSSQKPYLASEKGAHRISIFELS